MPYGTVLITAKISLPRLFFFTPLGYSWPFALLDEFEHQLSDSTKQQQKNPIGIFIGIALNL